MVVFSPSFAGHTQAPQFKSQTSPFKAAPPLHDEVKFGKNKKIKRAEVVLNKSLPGFEAPGYFKSALSDAVDLIPVVGDILNFKKNWDLRTEAKALGLGWKNPSMGAINALTALDVFLDFFCTTGVGNAVDEALPSSILISALVRKFAVKQAERIARQGRRRL